MLPGRSALARSEGASVLAISPWLPNACLPSPKTSNRTQSLCTVTACVLPSCTAKSLEENSLLPCPPWFADRLPTHDGTHHLSGWPPGCQLHTVPSVPGKCSGVAWLCLTHRSSALTGPPSPGSPPASCPGLLLYLLGTASPCWPPRCLCPPLSSVTSKLPAEVGNHLSAPGSCLSNRAFICPLGDGDPAPITVGHRPRGTICSGS